MRKALIILSITAFLAVVFVPPASAQIPSAKPIDKSTLLTFNKPVSLPEVTLPAGTYMFKLVDPINAPGALWVMSKDGRAAYALMNTIPLARTETESNHRETVTFRETGVDRAPEINAWFFNADETPIGYDDTGCEVIYSK